MVSLDELLTGRRSIRKYKAEKVPEAWIEQMLRAAVLAPSSGNSQPVRFIRISSQDTREALREALEAGRKRFLLQAERSEKPKKLTNWINAYFRFSAFMFSAPVLLALGTVNPFSGLSRILAEAGLFVPDGRWKTDGDIALGLNLQGMMLKAQELGLGTCILTAPLVFIAKAEEIIGFRDGEIKCFLTIGFPDESPSATPRKDLTRLYREL